MSIAPTMLTIKEAAKQSGLAQHYLRQLCISGKIVFVRAGNKYLINYDMLIDYLNNGDNSTSMIGVPWLLAFSLRENGWYLRSDIIWHKKNCMPESVKDRPSKCYEHIFLLSKSPQYYYDYEAVKEPAAESSIARYKRGVSDKTKYRDKKQGIFMPRDKTDFSDMRNKRDVWSVAINSAHIPGHFAVYPEKLIEPCILAGTKVGGIVLDPFFGSGTTGVAAIKNGRQYIGIDINPDYCKTAQDRIEKIKNETEMNDFGNQNK